MNLITCLFLSSNVVDEIIYKNNILNNGFENMHVIDEIQNLSLSFYFIFIIIHNITQINIFLLWEM
jgi:hypothetical protein